MKLFFFNLRPMSRSAGNPSPKQEATGEKPLLFAFGYAPREAMPELQSKLAGTWSGRRDLVASPDEDTRGLSAEYLRNEACKSLFLGQLYLVLGVNAVIGVFALAVHREWLAALAVSIPSSFFWRNAITECRRACRLYTSANLNAAE